MLLQYGSVRNAWFYTGFLSSDTVQIYRFTAALTSTPHINTTHISYSYAYLPMQMPHILKIMPCIMLIWGTIQHEEGSINARLSDSVWHVIIPIYVHTKDLQCFKPVANKTNKNSIIYYPCKPCTRCWTKQNACSLTVCKKRSTRYLHGKYGSLLHQHSHTMTTFFFFKLTLQTKMHNTFCVKMIKAFIIIYKNVL